MGKISNLKIASLLGIVFFILCTLTLKDYGINWDTINHLPRGQAYLRYITTGKKDYSDLPLSFRDWQKPGQWYWQNPESLWIDADIPKNEVPTRSMYQNSNTTYDYFIENDGYGHPPLSDILSSVFNRVLFSKLRIVNDIDSYRVYGVFLSALLIGLVFYWASKTYGRIAGLISAASLALYPLFWSESHFNTEKDIPETVYWSFFLFCIWNAITKKSIKWVLGSGIMFGLALGTKFNILFSVFVIMPWIVSYFLIQKEKLITKINVKILIAGLISLGIALAIFVVSWPYLWSDPIGKIQDVIHFYRDIGIATGAADPRFIGPFNINTYPIFWIITTTPPIILVLSFFGIVFSILNYKKNKQLSILFLLWLVVPIARVTWNQANIYGGIRQIMEYVPALALLSGLGGSWLLSKLKILKRLKPLALALIVLLLLTPIIKTHPNENTYFNFLVGGLSGAKEKEVPSWGNSFGAAYRQGIIWINKNLPEKADLTFNYELIPNVPRIWVRTDINLNPINRSGFLRKGEYSITLDYQGTEKRSYYDMYLNSFFNPVYQAKVDGIPVVTVWKNDESQLKKPWIEKEVPKVITKKTPEGFSFDLNKIYKISKLSMTYRENNCSKLKVGYFEISKDLNTWTRTPGVLPEDWRISNMGEQPKNGKFIEPFVGQEVRYVRFIMSPTDTCLLKNYTSAKFYYLE